MSKQNLVKFMQTMAEDEQLLVQLQQADSFETIKNLAAKQGYELGNLRQIC